MFPGKAIPGTHLRIVLFASLGVVAVVIGLLYGQPTPNQPTKSKVLVSKVNDEGFGYTEAFEQELKKIGQITPQQFAKMYPSKANYIPGLSWEPTTAKFWDEIQQDPLKGKKGFGLYDFRLNDKELAAFKKNGFVVSERLGAASFGEMFYRIYNHDLPVYISSDAVLHAWHRTYDAMLEELEESYLHESLNDLLTSMANQLPKVQQEYGKGIMEESVKDADYFLAVARSLLQGSPAKTHLNQEPRLAKTLERIEQLGAEKFYLFGKIREIDFSQFKVRGHYENSELLKKYFKAMMWCGRTDMRVAGGNEENATGSSPRELGGALVLLDLLQKAGKFEQWQQFDQIIQTFVGKTDSMTFAHLKGIAKKAGIQSPGQIKKLEDLTAIQKDILAGKIGMQHIRGDIVYSSPFGTDKAELPRSFTLLGQKFVMDSWTTAKVVTDDVIWDDVRVQRRIPSCLDVAFAVFGNDQTVPLLVQRMSNPKGKKFRDGLNYQHNLAAVRNILDSQDKKVWDENIYMNWLSTVRELSEPTTDAKYPEVMRTKEWAMKTLNTQLASWAQLRHDTILYVKQSYTAGAKCFYPAGYVEPVPHFWIRLEKMANSAAKLIEQTPFGPHQVLQKKQATFLLNFAKQVAVLNGIAVKELDQKPLSAAETKFLQEVVRIKHGSGTTVYNGWYPGLFYKGGNDCAKWDALVADVHTDVPAPILGDPGCVLTQGVGNIDLLMIAIDNGKDKMVYAGPVLSHYEIEMPAYKRKADSEWRKDINEGNLPQRPEWTEGYLVTGTNPMAKVYK